MSFHVIPPVAGAQRCDLWRGQCGARLLPRVAERPGAARPHGPGSARPAAFEQPQRRA